MNKCKRCYERVNPIDRYVKMLNRRSNYLHFSHPSSDYKTLCGKDAFLWKVVK